MREFIEAINYCQTTRNALRPAAFVTDNERSGLPAGASVIEAKAGAPYGSLSGTALTIFDK